MTPFRLGLGRLNAVQSVSWRYSRFLRRSVSLSDSVKKCNSIKNMTHKGQGNIDPWELSAAVSALLMSVLMKILYILKHTYRRLLKYPCRRDLLHVVVAFGGRWWYRSLNPCVFWVCLHQMMNFALGLITQMQLHWCRSTNFLNRLWRG